MSGQVVKHHNQSDKSHGPLVYRWRLLACVSCNGIDIFIFLIFEDANESDQAREYLISQCLPESWEEKKGNHGVPLLMKVIKEDGIVHTP